MPFDLGKAKRLTSGGEAFVEKDLITDDNYCVMTHKNVEERGVDLKVNQSIVPETPQPVKTFQNIDETWLVNVSSDRRVTSITFQAWNGSPITDGVLNIRRAGESFYQEFLGAIPDGVETTFDLTGAGFVPIDLIDSTAYTMTILSQSGAQIELIGDFPDLPFYKWEFHELTPKELGYKEDVYPVVQTGINGINFEDSNALGIGGNCLIHSDKVNDTMAAVIEQPFNSPNPVARKEGVFINNFPVFTILADTLTNPSFTFASGLLRLTDITMMSAGVQTNVVVRFTESISGFITTEVRIPSIPASGAFSVNFLDTSIGNTFQDIDATYILDVFSADGDVLLLGETATDQPWMTIDAYQLTNETIPFFSDLGAIDGSFYVDINTTVPAPERDGSIFRPYQQISEAQTGAGAATVSAQHTFIIASGSYTAITLGKFEHIVSRTSDGQSVIISMVTINFSGGVCSLSNCRANDLIYDTTGAGDAAQTTVHLNNVDSNGGIVASGRGAGSDIIVQDGFSNIDDITVTNTYFKMTDVYPEFYTGNTSISSTSLGVNLRNGHSALMELNDVLIDESAVVNATASGNTSCKFLATTARDLPLLFTNRIVAGDTITIAYDAVSRPSGIVDIGMASVRELLDKAISVDFDNTASGAVSTNVQGVIDEMFATQISNSILRNGSFDTGATEISINTATTFDTTTGDFGFIVDPITGEKIIKTYTGEVGVDVTNFEAMDFTGVQRNIFVYVDVEPVTPVLKLSFDTADGQPETFVYIGNFDLTEDVTPFDTLTSANQIVYTAYNQPSTGALLDVTKQNYRLRGLRFNGGAVANMDLGITAGEGIRVGANTIANYKQPDRPPANTLDFINALNRQYLDPAGDTITVLETGQTLTTTHYALNGVLTALSPSSRFQVIYLYVFPKSWSVRAMLGTAQYATIPDARVDVVKDPIGESDQTHEAILTTALIVAGNATDLTNPAQAVFVPL